MSIGPKDVLHVARLAELDVAEADLPKLVDQLNGIVAFVAQLDEVRAEGDPHAAFVAGPPRVALREDVPGSVPLQHPIAAFAPAFTDHLFTVPRHGAMTGADDAAGDDA